MTGDPPRSTGGVLGVLVAYRPGPELAEVVLAATPQVDRLFLWDNTEPGLPGARERLPRGGSEGQLELVRAPENRGLAVAYNRALEFALAHGFRYLFLLDQDSRALPGTVARLTASFAVFGPGSRAPAGGVNARNLEELEVRFSPKAALARLLEARLSALRRRQRLASEGPLAERWTATNSGLLLDVGALRSVGGFDERLFLDAVDYDLSFRLRDSGYHLFRRDDALVRHRQGVPATVLGRPIRGYPPRRSYHLVRDTTICARTGWSTDRSVAFGILLSMWLGTLGALVLLPERGERAHQILEGMRDAARTARTAGRVRNAPGQSPV